MKNKNILVLKHKNPSHYDDLGILRQVLDANGATLDERCTFMGDEIPESLADHDALIVMGGEMGVYDNLPYINDEMRFMERVINRRAPKPVLGICLGSQMLAHVAGGKVHLGEKGMEVGYSNLDVSEPESLIGDELDSAKVFHWHRDTFTVPRGVDLIATNDFYPHQAIKFGDHAYGFQFHPEVDTSVIRAWYAYAQEGNKVPPPDLLPLEDTLEIAKTHVPAVKKWLERFLKDFMLYT